MGTIYTPPTRQERRKIEDWWHPKVAISQTARVLKRHKSTIYRPDFPFPHSSGILRHGNTAPSLYRIHDLVAA